MSNYCFIDIKYLRNTNFLSLIRDFHKIKLDADYTSLRKVVWHTWISTVDRFSAVIRIVLLRIDMYSIVSSIRPAPVYYVAILH